MPKILIADDSELLRKSLKNIFSNHDGWNVCGEAANSRQAVLMAHQLKPDVIILDIAMPMMDGLHAAIEILKGEPSVPIILYTLHKSDQIELEGKKAGARSVISKGENSEVLVEAIRELLGQAVALPLSIGEKTPAEVDLPKQVLAEPDPQPLDGPDGSAETDGAIN
jgi:two-component system chemotaxis response regulator CheY